MKGAFALFAICAKPWFSITMTKTWFRRGTPVGTGPVFAKLFVAATEAAKPNAAAAASLSFMTIFPYVRSVLKAECRESAPFRIVGNLTPGDQIFTTDLFHFEVAM